MNHPVNDNTRAVAPVPPLCPCSGTRDLRHKEGGHKRSLQFPKIETTISLIKGGYKPEGAKMKILMLFTGIIHANILELSFHYVVYDEKARCSPYMSLILRDVPYVQSSL